MSYLLQRVFVAVVSRTREERERSVVVSYAQQMRPSDVAELYIIIRVIGTFYYPSPGACPGVSTKWLFNG